MRDGTPPPPPRGKGLLSRHRAQAASDDAPARSTAHNRPPRRPPPPPPPPPRPRAIDDDARLMRGSAVQPGLTSVRMPAAPGVTTGMPAPGASLAEWEATRRHHIFSLFHDGNAGHLWRGEVVSLLGEALLNVGVMIWLMFLVGSPGVIMLAALALGLPYLLAGPLAVPLQNSQDPGRVLRWIGQLRALLALGFVAMHYDTILPVVYLLLFGISLCGRLRAGGRIAAVRVCLAPGELERVSDDLHVGAALATVIGPLLATLLFVGLGERILLVSIGAFILFLINANSDGFLDPLAPERRAFLRARPEAAELAARADDAEHADIDPERLREEWLPEWYQQGPQRIGQWGREVRDGLALAGRSDVSQGALYGLGLLAFVGGGLSVLGVLYLTDYLQQPSFYYGPLVAAEAAGTALGLMLSGAAGRRTARPLLLGGVVGVGAMLVGLALLPRMPVIYALVFGLGIANAAAVTGARALLAQGATGRQRLAQASGEEFVIALCGVLGAPIFALFYVGSALARPLAPVARFFPGWPMGELLLGTGVGVAVAALVGAVWMARKPRSSAARSRQGARRAADRGRGRLPSLRHDEDEAYDENGTWREGESGAWASAEYPSAEWERAEYNADYDEEYADSRESRSLTGYGPRTGYEPAYGPETGEYEDYGDTNYRPRR